MDHRQFDVRSRNLIFVAACSLAIAGAACAAEPRKPVGASGGAGGSASGGSATGGRGGQGGVSSSGGTAGGGVGGTGGEAAAGGSPTGPDGGLGALDVAAADVGGKIPQGCTADIDCPSGRNCSGGACVNPKACSDSLGCDSTDLVCDPNRGFCVQCARTADCASGQSCLSNRCVSAVKCQAAADCGAGKVCDPSGRCVECSGNADCGANQLCMQNTCHLACESDKACTPQDMLCNLDLGICVQCWDQRPCAAGSYCDGSGICKLAICLPGESMCSGNGIAACKSDGTGFGVVNVCPATRSCQVYGGVAECAEEPVGIDAGGSVYDGGSTSDGGGTAIGGGPRTCGVSVSASPCTSLPNLIVTQTLDGKGDEFCDVPAFHLNAETAKDAGKVVVYNATPPEDATVKVAWSTAGIAIWIDVLDASVQSVNSAAPSQAIDKVYQGDSIELFIASSSDVKGSPGSDGNALHLTIPADGPAVLVKTITNNGTTTVTHTAWSASQYKQVKTTTGYAIEAQVPWPGSTPATGALVRFDIGLNSADKNFGGVDDMRDGQLLFYVGQVPSSSCQASDGTMPFCDDRTWCTTLLQ